MYFYKTLTSLVLAVAFAFAGVVPALAQIVLEETIPQPVAMSDLIAAHSELALTTEVANAASVALTEAQSHFDEEAFVNASRRVALYAELETLGEDVSERLTAAVAGLTELQPKAEAVRAAEAVRDEAGAARQMAGAELRRLQAAELAYHEAVATAFLEIATASARLDERLEIAEGRAVTLQELLTTLCLRLREDLYAEACAAILE